MDFKLLGFELRKENKFAKKLKKNTLYKFSNALDLENILLSKRERKIVVQNIDGYIDNLYKINGSDCEINVSALLGKNGSGKSSVLEIFYLLIFCLSETRSGYIDLRKKNKEIAIRNEDVSDIFLEINTSIEEILKDTQVDFYYQLEGNIFLLSSTSARTNLYRFNRGKWDREEFTHQNFFYTICVNYSIYGLNSNGDYRWLEGLFHKNDGYKTPIVLTPWRDKGNIDVNKENHFAQTRVLSNSTNDALEYNEILDEKRISAIEFFVEPSKYDAIEAIAFVSHYEFTKTYSGINLVELFDEYIYGFDNNFKVNNQHITNFLFQECTTAKDIHNRYLYNDSLFNSDHIRGFLAKYIVIKIIKICLKYESYRSKYTRISSKSENGKLDIFLISDVKGLLKQLSKDNTHVTLKLKQATHALLQDYFKDAEWIKIRNPNRSDQLMFKTTLKIDDFKIMIKNAHNGSMNSEKSIIQLIPASFYQPSIIMTDGRQEFPMSHMSSGEQHMIHSIHSVIYHLLNVDSLDNERFKYRAVNIFLDEIELYYHPEYQRIFVERFLTELSKLKLKNIKGINILFSTHSPFILSDINHYNVLKLRDGLPLKFDSHVRTFGANIHTMLSDSFFLEMDLLGSYARRIIEECLVKLNILLLENEIKNYRKEIESNSDNENPHFKHLNFKIKHVRSLQKNFLIHLGISSKQLLSDASKDQLIKTISLIGEPVIRLKLLEMFEEAYQSDFTDKKDKDIRKILKLMEEAGLKKEDL
jgi:hypothetical protein